MSFRRCWKTKYHTLLPWKLQHLLIPGIVPIQILARGPLIELSPSDWSGGGKDQSRIGKIKAWSVLQLSSSLGRERSGTKDRQLADKSVDRSGPVTPRVCQANNNVVNQSTKPISILSTNNGLLEGADDLTRS